MFEEQQLAFDKFSKLKVGALFMKMGTGKTKVALDLVNYNNVDYLLYVTPFSAKSNIEKEIKKWGCQCPYDIIGYETISSSDKKYLELLTKLVNKKVFIIADESIFIKNEDTKRFNRLLTLRNKCEYALILNGTPIIKNEWDLYNQMYFLSPLIIGMNRQQFLNAFFKKITYKKLGQAEKIFYKFSEKNAEALNKMISPYLFQCDLNFGNKIKTNYEIINCSYDLKTYQDIKNIYLENYLKNRDSAVIINLLTQLNYISSLAKEKMEALIEYIERKKVIVYCNYLEEVKIIASKIECFVLTGETKQRNIIINDFEKSNIPLIMTYGVGSYSLNLQFCNEIVFSSLTFDYGKIEQSKYRIKRIGQDKNIKYTYFLSNYGINKIILENLEKKRVLKDLIKEKLEKGENEWIKNL